MSRQTQKPYCEACSDKINDLLTNDAGEEAIDWDDIPTPKKSTTPATFQPQQPQQIVCEMCHQTNCNGNQCPYCHAFCWCDCQRFMCERCNLFFSQCVCSADATEMKTCPDCGHEECEQNKCIDCNKCYGDCSCQSLCWDCKQTKCICHLFKCKLCMNPECAGELCTCGYCSEMCNGRQCLNCEQCLNGCSCNEDMYD